MANVRHENGTGQKLMATIAVATRAETGLRRKKSKDISTYESQISEGSDDIYICSSKLRLVMPFLFVY